MPQVLPEPIIRCPECLSTIAEIRPEWIGQARLKTTDNNGREVSNPWSFIRKKVLDQFREFGPLKGWMTQGTCCEKECEGKWWNGEKLNVAVPHHLKEAKDHGE